MIVHDAPLQISTRGSMGIHPVDPPQGYMQARSHARCSCQPLHQPAMNASRSGSIGCLGRRWTGGVPGVSDRLLFTCSVTLRGIRGFESSLHISPHGLSGPFVFFSVCFYYDCFLSRGVYVRDWEEDLKDLSHDDELLYFFVYNYIHLSMSRRTILITIFCHLFIITKYTILWQPSTNPPSSQNTPNPKRAQVKRKKKAFPTVIINNLLTTSTVLAKRHPERPP